MKMMSMMKMTTNDENAVNVIDELWTGLVTLYLVLALQPWQGLIVYVTNLIEIIIDIRCNKHCKLQSATHNNLLVTRSSFNCYHLIC